MQDRTCYVGQRGERDTDGGLQHEPEAQISHLGRCIGEDRLLFVPVHGGGVRRCPGDRHAALGESRREDYSQKSDAVCRSQDPTCLQQRPDWIDGQRQTEKRTRSTLGVGECVKATLVRLGEVTADGKDDAVDNQAESDDCDQSRVDDSVGADRPKRDEEKSHGGLDGVRGDEIDAAASQQRHRQVEPDLSKRPDHEAAHDDGVDKANQQEELLWPTRPPQAAPPFEQALYEHKRRREDDERDDVPSDHPLASQEWVPKSFVRHPTHPANSRFLLV